VTIDAGGVGADSERWQTPEAESRETGFEKSTERVRPQITSRY